MMWVGSNGYMMDGIQVHKGMTVSQRKSSNVWIYNTVCTLATLGAHSPCINYTVYTLATLGAHSPGGPMTSPAALTHTADALVLYL
jgi:hypothetical protein